MNSNADIGVKMRLPILLIVLVLVSGCARQQIDQEPARVVEAYFTAWNNKDYPTMYGFISDAFKRIEPTAISVESFKKYAESQEIERVEIRSIKLQSNDGSKAAVDYDIVFTISGGSPPFRGTFTLKYKQNDTRPGWKLIHPYGDNIDIT